MTTAPCSKKWGEYDLARYNGPSRGAKTQVLEGGIRVPAIIRWPDGIDANKIVHDMVHFSDWLPTLLDVAGVTPRDHFHFDGKSCLPVLRGERAKLETKRFWQFNRYDPVPRCNAAMRDDDWTLYWPDIPEAMKKMPSDTEWYLRMMTEPHFYTHLTDNPSVERSVPSPGVPHLYNIAEDPYERNDLAAENPERLKRMIDELDNWLEKVDVEIRALLRFLV